MVCLTTIMLVSCVDLFYNDLPSREDYDFVSFCRNSLLTKFKDFDNGFTICFLQLVQLILSICKSLNACQHLL